MVRALSAIAVRLVGDLKDGKVSLAEVVAFLGDYRVLREGMDGVGLVPAELRDLDPVERDILLGDIRNALISAGVSHRTSDAAERILRWAFGTVDLVLEVKGAPVSAVLVAD